MVTTKSAASAANGSVRQGATTRSGKASTSATATSEPQVDPSTFGALSTWTPTEQNILETELAKYPLEKYTPLQRYVQVAAKLEHKTVRDVALRVAFSKKDKNGKKRKNGGDDPVLKKPKEKRETRSQSIFSVGIGQPMGPAPSMSMGSQSSVGASIGPPQVTPMSCAAQIPILEDHGASTSGGLGGPTEQLLEQNLAVIKQIRDNWQQCLVAENSELLCQFRDNLLKTMNTMASMSGIMNQMPNLPVKINLELASQLLPPPPAT